MPQIENLAQKVAAVFALMLGVCFLELAKDSPPMTAIWFFVCGVFNSTIGIGWYVACRYSEGIS